MHHAGVTVRDLERSIAFYERFVGAQVLWRRAKIESEYVRGVVGLSDACMSAALLHLPDGGALELVQYDHPKGEFVRPRPCDIGGVHLAFVVGDVASLYERLAAAGVEITSTPECLRGEGRAGGFRFLQARDPDGALLEFMEKVA
jgi:lactoylglutathione lyase